MTTLEEPIAVDGAKLEQFVFRAVEEVGATLNAALVVMGDRLGLYRALAGAGGLTPVELARRSGVSERYVREWLNAQAAGGYVEYDPADDTYTLPPEQAIALTHEDEPCLPARVLPDRARSGNRLAARRREGTSRRGLRLARAQPRCVRGRASASSAPATTRTSSRPGCRRSTASSRSSRPAPGRRHRLRARRVDDPDGAGVPELHLRGLGLPPGLDRDRTQAGRGSRRRRPRDASRRRRRRRIPVTGTTS